MLLLRRTDVDNVSVVVVHAEVFVKRYVANMIAWNNRTYAVYHVAQFLFTLVAMCIIGADKIK